MAITQYWDDNAGLHQVYGVDQATTENGGEYRNYGNERSIEIKIDLTSLNQNEVVQMDNVFFPVGMKITEIEVFVETAAATGVAIDLGFIRTDRTTEIDYDGLLAAFPTATMTVGNKVVLRKGGTNAGAMVGSGVATTNVGLITCSATTATAFTAGLIKVTIRYERP
jgi:hypothetical protein